MDNENTNNNSSAVSESAKSDVAESKITGKREDYLSWDDYFMSIAFLAAQRSKDPYTQVGACIVNDEKKIVGIGYNGMPIGISDDVIPWGREGANRLNTKHPYVVHAETNAILNKNSADLKNCVLYVALFPCNECAKVIIQSGIREVIYFSDKYHQKEKMVASRILFDRTGVKYKQFIPKQKKIVINFEDLMEEFQAKEAPNSLENPGFDEANNSQEIISAKLGDLQIESS